jgi:hypothetical protein
MAITKNSQIDLNGNEMILDADGDTTITADTDDQIDFKTGGTDRVTIDSSGNVGIGTTSPDFLLDVEGSNTQVKVGAASQDGGFLTSTDNNQLIVSGGFYYDGSNFIAASTSASGVSFDNGAAAFYNNTSLTDGNSFTLTETMRIDSSGNVGIGATSSLQKLSVTSASGTVAEFLGESGPHGLRIYGNDGGFGAIGHVSSGSYDLAIDSNGAVMFHTTTALGATTSLAGTNTNNFTGKTTTDTYSNFLGFASGGNITYYVTGQGNYFFNGSAVSDRDLKENIESITESSLAKVKLLEPKTFNFKADDNFGTNKKTGFIAQEVAAIFGTTDGVATGTDGQKDMGIDPTGLIAHLTKAIQEQQEQIEALQSEINTLKGG